MSKHENLICVCAGRNKGLRNLLHAWTRVVLRYCELHQFKDNPWWANERASVSTLAAAAWTLEGWCALEEFSTKKRGVVPNNQVEEDGQRNGRCDLYVSNKGTSYVLEAKQAWQPIGGKKPNGNGHLKKGMKNAWGDAARLDAKEADHRFAATFIVPHVSPTKVGEKGANVRKLVEDWLDSVNIRPRGKRPLIYAYVFLGGGQGFVSDVSGRAFPGVMLVLEERMRAAKSPRSK